MTFKTASEREYILNAWCIDISNNVYMAQQTTSHTAASNGGVPLTLTYGVSDASINDLDNNDMVLEITCIISEGI